MSQRAKKAKETAQGMLSKPGSKGRALKAFEMLGGPQDGERVWLDATYVEQFKPLRLRWPVADDLHLDHIYMMSSDGKHFEYAGVGPAR